ncbi:unnamed protein product [Alopecurus aequalis]
MAFPPPPCSCCTCRCGAPLSNLSFPSPYPSPSPSPFRPSVFALERPSWMSQLAEADFSKACVADRVCNTCGGAAFCEHCCSEHHRGHDTSAADHAVAHRRDSFCTACRVAFCSDLCAHHAEGHEVIPVVDYDRWYCARCTGSERWFPVFDGVQTFREEHGNVLVPLHWKPEAVPDAECRAWVSQLFDADFSETCVTDRVCNTCGGAGFCEHCCGEHHPGHDTAAVTDTAAATVHKRDSFCVTCRVAFCSDLCADHHAVGGGSESHEVIPIDDYDGWHFARCTRSERWFLAAFGGIQTYRDKHGNVLVPLMIQKLAAITKCPSWFSKLVSVDFSKTCTRDRVCNTCGGAGFCEHCCGEQHRGHDTAAATDTAAAKVHKRDSFCIGCRVAFCSDLCAHHAAGGEGEDHEVIPIVEYDIWYCARCTGSEWWFLTGFAGGATFEDEHGNLLVPLRQKKTPDPEPGRKHRVAVQEGEECPSWMYQLLTVNFSKTCARDRVCNTCGGAAFCGHCCGEHHQGHDTTAKEKDGSVASEGHRRDSFCIDCSVGFCSELCAHHAGHEVIPIDAYGDRHFVRSNGPESWFTPSAFGGIQTFEDKDGNLMVPLERKKYRFPEPGLRYRYDTPPHHGGTTTPPTAANQFKLQGGEVR